MKKNDYQTKKQAQEYGTERFSGGLSLVDKDEAGLIKEWLKKIDKSRFPIFLDLGTGTGRIIKEHLKHNPKTIYALDQSEAMLKTLAENFSKEIKRGVVKTIKANADRTGQPNNLIDIVTSLHLFKHFSNIEPVLKEVARILKPGGHFIFDALNQKSIIKFNLGTCYAVGLKELRKKLKNEGFLVKEFYFMHNFGETIYNLLGKSSSKPLHLIDKKLSQTKLNLGTKIFILARKNE